MRKHKTLIICVLAALALFAIGWIILDRVALNNLNNALANIPDARVHVNKLHVSLIAGNLELGDVEFALVDSTNAGQQVEGRVETIKLERLHWSDVFHGEARADRLLIRGPEARLVLVEKAPQEQTDSTEASAGSSFLKTVSLGELKLEKGSVGLRNRGDSLKVSVKDFAFSVRDIGISFADSSSVEYNDSTYSVTLDSLDFTDAQGLSRILIGHLSTADAGAVEAQNMHLYNCVPMEQVAERMGKVSSMWYNAKLDSLRTSAINIPRIIKDKCVVLDSVHLVSPEIVMFQDDRYPPKVPYPTLQEGLNSVDMPLHIKHIDASIKLFTFIWETTHVNRGTFPMHNLRLTLNSVSNASNNVMEMGIRCGKKGNGFMNMSLSVKNDKQESTHGKMLIKELNPECLDPFVRPLFGATAKADIHQIDYTFKGDKDKLDADFCMLYENLSVKAWDDESAPIRIVADNSGFVTGIANLVLPKSNPAVKGKDPKRVEYTVERDPMLPYPSYLISCLTNGMLHTILPGKSVRKSKK